MWCDGLTMRVAGAVLVLCVLGQSPAGAQSLNDRLAKANPAKGANAFDGCRGCHSVEEGGATLLGPNLWSIINRKVASADGFDYSDALKEFGGKWELGRLDEFLADPAGTVPGTRMVVPGVTDDATRANLIAYLNQNGAEPLPIGIDPELAEAEADASQAQDEGKRAYGLLVDAPGVEKTHAYCTSCHSEMIIVQQGKTRKRWDDALTWMTETQGMVDIKDPDRAIILDYLAEHYNEDRPNFPQR